MIQPFTKGNPETIRKMNEIIDFVNSLARMTGDGFVLVQHSINGVTTISLSMNELKARMMNFGGTVAHLAFSQSAAAANTNPFNCYLDTDGTGKVVSVTPTLNTTVTAMTLAAPLLHDGTPLVIWNDSGTWRTYVTFEDAGPC